jgi:hypothetical protein
MVSEMAVPRLRMLKVHQMLAGSVTSFTASAAAYTIVVTQRLLRSTTVPPFARLSKRNSAERNRIIIH